LAEYATCEVNISNAYVANAPVFDWTDAERIRQARQRPPASSIK